MGLSFGRLGATWRHWYHQTVLGHFLVEVSLRLPVTAMCSAFIPLTLDCVGGLGTTFRSVLYTSHILKELNGSADGKTPPFQCKIILGFRNHLALSPIPICLIKFGSQHHLTEQESDASSMNPAMEPVCDRQTQKKTEMPWSRQGKFSLASFLTLLFFSLLPTVCQTGHYPWSKLQLTAKSQADSIAGN